MNRYIARSPDVAARRIGGELMIMSGRDSSLFSLNETAAALWEAADGATPLAGIVEREICACFEVDPAEALRRCRGAGGRAGGPRHPASSPRPRSRDERAHAGNGRPGARARHPARRAPRPHLPVQRALRALLPRPRGPRRDDHRRDPARAGRRGRRGDLLPHALGRRDLHAPRPLRDHRAREEAHVRGEAQDQRGDDHARQGRAPEGAWAWNPSR